MATVYLGLGSNLGDRLGNLRAALAGIAAFPLTRVDGSAGIYETPPVGGPPGQGAYLNTVCRVTTDLTPRRMLAGVHRLERDLGRNREAGAQRWGPRTIDIDILLWDDLTFAQTDPGEPALFLPHPRLTERAFVLLPLAELAPEFRHPVTGRTVEEHLDMIGREHEGIRRLSF